jgi:hypothetical protein
MNYIQPLKVKLNLVEVVIFLTAGKILVLMYSTESRPNCESTHENNFDVLTFCIGLGAVAS